MNGPWKKEFLNESILQYVGIWWKPIAGFKFIKKRQLLNHCHTLRDSRANLAHSLVCDVSPIAPVVARAALC